MSSVKENLKYTKTHEWIRAEADGTLTVGITDHAQELLGDMVYIELPTMNQHYAATKEICVVESVKAAADVYCPITGTVIEVNEAAAQDPAQVNQDAYGAGWLFKLRPDNANDVNTLIDASTYKKQLEDESH